MKRFLACFFLLCVLVELTRANYTQLTNLPSVYINTFDGLPINSKEYYLYCRIIWVEGDSIRKFDSVQIRGRGNASWGFPKKPYRIKFKKKERLLGSKFANARNWVLLSNGGEKLMLRNALNSFVGSLNGLPFNPAAKFVDLYVNHVYKGTYQITDHIDIRKKRVNIVEQNATNSAVNVTGGYLMEQDGYTDPNGIYFTTGSGAHIRIHSPDDDVITTRHLDYIKTFMANFEEKLFSDNYLDERRGYRPYIDSLTLLGWYLSSEIGSNFDLFHSTYFYKNRNDNHLYFGPLWDNDLGYNHDSRYGDETATMMVNVAYGASRWFKRIYSDPWFKRACAYQFSQLYENGLDRKMLAYLDSVIAEIRPSVDENFKVWDIHAIVHSDRVVFDTYEEYVEDIKTFIVNHNAFLYRTFRRLAPALFVYDDRCYYRFWSSTQSSYLLGLADAGSTESAICMRRGSESLDSHLWELIPEGRYYRVKNVSSGQYLSNSQKKRARAYLEMVDHADNDSTLLWDLVGCTEEHFNLRNVYTDNVVTNYNSGGRDGNPVYGYLSAAADTANASRLWTIEKIAKATDAPDAVRPVAPDVEYRMIYNSESATLRVLTADVRPVIFKADVYNLAGIRIGSFRSDETFDLSGQPDGTYIVSWQYGGRSHSTKFIKN